MFTFVLSVISLFLIRETDICAQGSGLPGNGSAFSFDDIEEEQRLFQDQSPREVADRCTALIETKTVSSIGLAQIYYERGVARARLGESNSAIGDFDQALRLNASLSCAMVAKARVYVSRLEFNRAAQMLDQAGPLKNDPLVMGSRALIFIQQNRLDKAMILLNEAIRINPEEARLYILRGMVNYVLNRPHAGEEDMACGRQLNPAWADVYTSAVAQSEQEKRDTPDAAESVPIQAEDACRSVALLFRNGQFSEALNQADRIITLNPGLLRVRLYRARSLLALGRHADAIPDLTFLIEKTNGREDLFLLRASAYYGASDYANALADYRRVLEFNPRSVPADEWILRIQTESGIR